MDCKNAQKQKQQTDSNMLFKIKQFIEIILQHVDEKLKSTHDSINVPALMNSFVLMNDFELSQRIPKRDTLNAFVIIKMD